RHLTDLKLATTFGNNQVSAQAVHRLLEDGSYRKQVAAVRERLRRAAPPLRKKLEALGFRVWTENAEGMFLWMALPEGAGDAAHLAARAIERGIVLAPGSVFSPSQRWARFMRFNIAQSASPRLVAFLAEALR
ncbi:MAG: aminotransferase class I/II-fold pyridoxal phosphate-dependent enzyme, partial [Dongia sp.]